MKAFLILTALCALGLFVVSVTMPKIDPSGISMVVGWAFVLGAYIFTLLAVGFASGVARFRDGISADPKMDHPGHRMGLVRTTQLPDFMQKGAEPALSSIPKVARSPRNR